MVWFLNQHCYNGSIPVLLVVFIMKDKKEQFAKLLTKWRGVVLPKDKKYRDTVPLYIDYFDTFALNPGAVAKMNQDLIPKAKQFDDLEINGGRSKGALLYCKLAAQHALDTIKLDDKERSILSDLDTVLSDLYDNLMTNPEKNLNSLFSKINSALDLRPEEHADKKQAQTMAVALYATLKIIDSYIDTLNSVAKYPARKFISLFKKDVPALLKRTEQKITALENARKAVVSVDPVSVVHKTIEDQFNERHIAVLESTASKKEGLDKLSKNLGDLSADIRALITAKDVAEKEKKAIETQISEVEALRDAVVANGAQVMGRKYFKELVKNNATYDTLVEKSSRETSDEQSKKNNLLSNTKKLDGRVATALYLGSIVTSPLAILGRLTAQALDTSVSTAIQKVAAIVVPKTTDSACKDDLVALAEERIATLKKQLTDEDEALDKAVNKLAGGNAALKELLVQAPSDRLAEVASTSLATQAAVVNNALYASQAQGLVADLDKIIKQHKGFGVMMSNFFAIFNSSFKTDTAKAIGRAIAMKNELVKLQKKYKNDMETALTSIQKNPHISPIIKTKLTDVVRDTASQAAAVTDKSQSNQKAAIKVDALDKRFESFKKQMNEMQSRTEQVSESSFQDPTRVRQKL